METNIDWTTEGLRAMARIWIQTQATEEEKMTLYNAAASHFLEGTIYTYEEFLQFIHGETYDVDEWLMIASHTPGLALRDDFLYSLDLAHQRILFGESVCSCMQFTWDSVLTICCTSELPSRLQSLITLWQQK